jgi:hypothetical protein
MVLLNAEVSPVATRAMDSSVVVQAKRPDAWHKHEQLMLMEKQKPKRKFLWKNVFVITDMCIEQLTCILNGYTRF